MERLNKLKISFLLSILDVKSNNIIVANHTNMKGDLYEGNHSRHRQAGL